MDRATATRTVAAARDPLEPYPCPVGNGWHVRTARWISPNRQWTWLEDETDAPITGAIADALTEDS